MPESRKKKVVIQREERERKAAERALKNDGKEKKVIKKNDVRKPIGPVTKRINEYYKMFENTVEKYFYLPTVEQKTQKKKCEICGQELPDVEFWKNYSYASAGRMTESGKICAPVCRRCAQKLFEYYYYEDESTKDDITKSIEHVCCDLNIYWDVDCYNSCREVYEKNKRNVPIMSEYIGEIGRRGEKYIGLTYWDSPTIVNRGVVENSEDVVKQNEDLGWDTPLTWSKEDANNRKLVMRIYRYDPFENDDEETRKSLYRDLATMLDDAMADDYVKSRGALEVVRGFNRLDALSNKIAEMERNGDDIVSIQKIVDIKQKERNSITAFCKDNGFSASYANKKAKGAGTLSGVMAEINEKQYEKGVINMYDVETSESMLQAAKISMQAIFDQLNFGSNESYTVIQQQREMIQKMNRQVRDLQEENRKLNCKIVEIKLKKKEAEVEAELEGDTDD